MKRAGLAALCLAAGRGTRLAPITDALPKPLCPAGADRLLGRALARTHRHAGRVAVNAHHHADQIVDFVAALGSDVEVVVETRLLGTGGAVGNIVGWLGDDDLLIGNADTVLEASTDRFVSEWDGERLRMLVVVDQTRPDFHGVWRYAGLSLVPNRLAKRVPAYPANLSEELFMPEWTAGRVELVAAAGFYMDCATPLDLLLANLALNGGETVVGDDAVLDGVAESSLLMPGAVVAATESIAWSIRLQDGSTIDLGERVDT